MKEITVHIFQAGEYNGVNAKHGGKWLMYDDAFTSLLRATSYAQQLARKLNATKIVCDWNGSEIEKDTP